MKLIVAEGAPDELRDFFGEGFPLNGAFAVQTRGESPDGSASVNLERELSAITDRARRAIEQISRHAPRVSFDKVAELGGFSDTRELGGGMSSLGHSAPRISRMIQRDWPRRQYVIEPENAEAILQALDRYRSGD